MRGDERLFLICARSGVTFHQGNDTNNKTSYKTSYE